MSVAKKIIDIKKEGGVVDVLDGHLVLICASRHAKDLDLDQAFEWCGGEGQPKRPRVRHTDDKEDPSYGTQDVPSWTLSSWSNKVLWPEKWKRNEP